MSAVTIQQMADRVAQLLEDRLSIRGKGLAEKLHKAGRRLPRKVRAAGAILAEGAVTAQNPKLYLQLDHEALARAYDVCVRHLGPINAGDRRRGLLLNFAASVAFSTLVVAVVVLLVLRWRGFI